ncbi:MAG: hypothetical protein Unbinned2299contig1000_32 [Prokaryotic dsDNA virus sp.]|jgi:hypothetical protein|nr:MAG: hypothetical protein Unbinned2299contig1000_32 [Prokaryotic dsDNA virus sp.]|tara:strand:- start:170 stop:352 length:183 start_codon:yes stop_codon:yes gene_type:complete
MPIKLKDVNTLNYINFTMDEINTLTSDIYESMIDSEYAELGKTIDVLIKKLNEVKKTHKK